MKQDAALPWKEITDLPIPSCPQKWGLGAINTHMWHILINCAKLHAGGINSNQACRTWDLMAHKWDASSFFQTHYNKLIILELSNYALFKKLNCIKTCYGFLDLFCQEGRKCICPARAQGERDPEAPAKDKDWASCQMTNGLKEDKELSFSSSITLGC